MTEQAKMRKREYDREYRAKNRDKVNEYARKWRKANQDKVRQYNENYWEKKLSANGG